MLHGPNEKNRCITLFHEYNGLYVGNKELQVQLEDF